MHENTIVFNSQDLQEKSTGLRFDLPQLGSQATGFLVRFDGKAYAYVNQCAHIPVELDWQEGEFFTSNKDYIICATHGAQYEPNTGHCVAGPCKGRRLQPLPVTEENEQVVVHVEQLVQNDTDINN